MAKITGSHLFVRSLKLEGIKKVFTIVGDTILPLVDAAADEGIEFIDTRHEGAAMHMADGYSRITGEPSVAMFTGGPGFSNAISGLPAIYTSESPVIFIAGCAELPGKGMDTFQEIDQIEMASPVTKGSWLIHDKTRIQEYVATAFRTAMSGRPGPVHLTLPMDIQEQIIDESDITTYQPQEYRAMGKSQGDPTDIQEAIRILSNSSKPIIIAGNAARYGIKPEQIEALVETTGIPIFTVEQARGLIDDNHSLCFGYGDGALNKTAKKMVDADAVLLLGKKLDYRYKFGHIFNEQAKLIQVDPSPSEIGRNRGVSVGILGDLGAVVEQLTQAYSKSTSKNNLNDWVKELTKVQEEWRQELEDKADGSTPMHPIEVFTQMKHLIDEDTFILLDGGDYVQWARSYLPAKRPGHFLRLGPLSHLGASVPYGMAAKVAYPNSKVFVFVGDGAFGFYPMEYDTCIRHNLNITTILGNDSTWGIDKTFQLAYYERAIGTDLRTVRYDKVVEAIGGHSEYVEQPNEIVPAIERSLSSGKPSLVNCVIRSGASPLAQAMIERKTSK
ncbi:MAG: hypothetical protein CL884_00665 [Dehalococcoidia bacterium]|nr:hypothetical protein [Dehalococcoidia bacterium]MQG26735.1 thiamine pyrophosphate-binding protein [SAR202 cluster bacterium]MQG52096.1 thiamine pyrophosphate-binding protein [SAR202 cluster bacterium]|tara:strand:+ start:7875 stop:9548 length:1674 start_codon:yes stop_codon:yes gene_type:complete